MRNRENQYIAKLLAASHFYLFSSGKPFVSFQKSWLKKIFKGRGVRKDFVYVENDVWCWFNNTLLCNIVKQPKYLPDMTV